ncbi:helix-turn-helix domain-containing protein [Undibacterium sp. Xuan67W]|uniref:helix-turn-helix domain-containing protein n=1 Tax=Undibacterium sp. Xuan67W TaxID=3413057 RepID=UPI003BF299EE
MSDPTSGDPVSFEPTGSFQYQELIKSRLGQPIAPELSLADAEKLAKSPGNRLIAGRNALGWTIEQVASQLRLAPRQIRALETEDYASLPEPAIVKGFVRAYAKLLKLDPTPLLALLTADLAQNTTSTSNPRSTRSRRSSTSSGQSKSPSISLKVLLFVSACGLLALAWFAFKQYRH